MAIQQPPGGEGLTLQAVRDQLKLSVDTGSARNVGSDRADFVAQVLSVFFDSADVSWEYGEKGTGLGNLLSGPPVQSESIVSKTPLGEFDGALEQTLTESGGSVRAVAIGDGTVAYGGYDNNAYVHSGVAGLLESGSTYEYRAVLEANGERREGQIRTFTTKS